MRCVAGSIYRPGEGIAEGWIVLDGDRVVDAGEGRPPRSPDATGFVIPKLVNAHTHIGDRAARGIDITGRSLADVVAPPDGLKHKILRETPRARIVAAMKDAIAESAQHGSRALIDFREQGLDGVRMMREAGAGIALGRCAGAWDDAEADAVAREADGIGLSAMRDVPPDVPARAAAAARRHRKRFAMHVSEAAREDVGRALDLRPDFLVHACAATHEDLDAIAAARVPIVLCPRSNAKFGRAPDAPAMLARGIRIALGTDNAMLQTLDVLEEARALAVAHPTIERHVWLDAAIVGGACVADGEAPRTWLRRGSTSGAHVLPIADEAFWKA